MCYIRKIPKVTPILYGKQYLIDLWLFKIDTGVETESDKWLVEDLIKIIFSLLKSLVI